MQQRQGQIQRLCLGGRIMASSSLIPFPLLPFRHPSTPPPPHAPPTTPPTSIPSHLPPSPLCGGFCLSDFTLKQRFPDENKEVQKVLPKKNKFFCPISLLNTVLDSSRDFPTKIKKYEKSPLQNWLLAPKIPAKKNYCPISLENTVLDSS